MLIKGLLNLIYGLLSLLLIFNLPALPETVTTILTQVSGYINTGVDIIRIFIGNSAMSVLALLLQLVIYLNLAYFLYSFVFWVVRKIPILNVKE